MVIPVTEAEAVRQFEIMKSRFQQAAEKNCGSLVESFYRFGGKPVRLRIVGRDFASQVVRPFSHLQTDACADEHPHLTVDLWDQDETGIRCSVGAANGGGHWNKLTAICPDGRFVGQQRPNSLTCYNRDASHIIAAVSWRGQLSIYERGKPLDRALLEWHNERQIQIIHAGLISRNQRGILLAGKSGSGKSTTALACLFAGFNFLSEDFVGLQRLAAGTFMGHSIYNSIFLKKDHLARFPRLSPYIINGMPHEEKSFVLLSQIFPDRLEQAVPIRALVLPRVVHDSLPSCRPATKAEALLAIGPSSFLQIPNRGLGVGGLDKIVQLIERVPCYWFEVNSDLVSIADRMDELFKRVAHDEVKSASVESSRR